MSELIWYWKSYQDLSVDDLYDLLQAREQVFVMEQNCLYTDIDGLDRHSDHLLGRNQEGTLLAYLRVIQAGLRYREISIGRVLTLPSARTQGYGKELTRFALDKIATLYPGQSIRISAQSYLTKFYENFGFQVVSEPYEEAGIWHVEMLRLFEL